MQHAPVSDLVSPPSEDILPTSQSGVEQLVARLKAGERTLDVTGLRGAARGLVLRQLLSQALGPVVAVAPDDDAADALERDLDFFLKGKSGPTTRPAVLRFQIDSILPYDDFSPDRELELGRLRTLFLLAQLGLGSKLSAAPTVLLTPARGLLRKVIPRSVMDAAAELLGKGLGSIPRRDLGDAAGATGFAARVPLVEDPGTFAVRGGVIDLFSPVDEKPARLELFGDEVESLRLFDPETQRTVAELPELYISPAREILIDDQTKLKGIAAAREAFGDRGRSPEQAAARAHRPDPAGQLRCRHRGAPAGLL